ncbi:cobalt transporter [Fulvitalea axinellae]|uniref:Cobalt transporter n=1 Tax=Fulvitalea axinellae TaxID=1182444 RepID=A0AAU9CQ27_9BACT|nr:cobalt transporter [Fulvitalea axinellae]
MPVSKIQSTILWVIVLNVAISLAQVVGGFMSSSGALLSDAAHNFSDVVALLACWWALGLSGRETSKHRTFGYRRAETLAAFANGLGLLVMAAFLLFQGISSIIRPVLISNTNSVIGLAIASLIVNALSAWLLRAPSRTSLNTKAAYVHLFSDMLTSVAVLVDGVLMKHTGAFWIDGLLTALISIYLGKVSLKLLKESTSVLMHFTPAGVDIESIKNSIDDIPEVDNVHHIHVWKLSDSEVHLEAHVEYRSDLSLSESGRVLAGIKKLLANNFGITHCTFQQEYGVKGESKAVVFRLNDISLPA